MFFLSLVSLDAFAQKRRAVVMPSSEKVTLSGEVRDAATSRPVVMAEVSAAGDLVRTDRAGKFTIQIPKGRDITVSVARTGYQTASSSLKLTANATQNFQVTSRATVRAVATDTKTYELDDDSVEFGYAIPFQGFHRDRVVKLCRAGEAKVDVDRADIKRIEGPMVTTTDTGCCATPITGMTFVRANGNRFVYYFADSCLGYPILLMGRDHATWEPVTIRFADVQEVVLP